VEAPLVTRVRHGFESLLEHDPTFLFGSTPFVAYLLTVWQR
jgi:hypothetical protein